MRQCFFSRTHRIQCLLNLMRFRQLLYLSFRCGNRSLLSFLVRLYRFHQERPSWYRMVCSFPCNCEALARTKRCHEHLCSMREV